MMIPAARIAAVAMTTGRRRAASPSTATMRHFTVVFVRVARTIAFTGPALLALGADESTDQERGGEVANRGEVEWGGRYQSGWICLLVEDEGLDVVEAGAMQPNPLSHHVAAGSGSRPTRRNGKRSPVRERLGFRRRAVYQRSKPARMNDGSSPSPWQILSKSRGPSVEVVSQASTSAKSRLPRPLDAVAYFWKSLTAPSSTASIRRFSGPSDLAPSRKLAGRIDGDEDPRPAVLAPSHP